MSQRFTCCAKGCRTFEPGLLVQLGYNGAGEALLFLPHWHREGLHLPENGFRLEGDPARTLQLLTVDAPGEEASPGADGNLQ